MNMSSQPNTQKRASGASRQAESVEFTSRELVEISHKLVNAGKPDQPARELVWGIANAIPGNVKCKESVMEAVRNIEARVVYEIEEEFGECHSGDGGFSCAVWEELPRRQNRWRELYAEQLTSIINLLGW